VADSRMRAVALVILVRPRDGAVLAVRMEADGRVFYRPPGGGIEFGELSADAASREAREELGQAVRVERLLGVVESHFMMYGEPRHEILFNWLACPQDESLYESEEIRIVEDNGDLFVAHWVHDADLVVQGIALYPRELITQLEAKP
jgi:ADP-ribose pyrophosphatase YjhB (NUDIX family)